MIPALSLLAPFATEVVGNVAGTAVGILSGGGASTAPAAASATDDFSAVLGQVATDTMSKLKTGEAAAISGVEGKMPVQQVVQSVLDAQQSLQTAIAIRDKVVAAYQEVTRMSI
jgi:flagellar hook-basal body complex protein FliE